MLLTGPDRLELIPALGRPLRVGSPEQLAVSDADRVRETLQGQDLERLQAYWGYVSFGHTIMVNIAYEWVLGWREFVGTDGATGALHALDGPEARPLRDLLARNERVSQLPGTALSDLLPDGAAVLRTAEAGNWKMASDRFEAAFAASRLLHDQLFRYSWAMMSALGDQGEVEEGLRAALTGSSFYDLSWQQSVQLSEQEFVAFMAEHLRLHFSGPQREGSVRIVEEVDRYRLLVDPCGSGGAMRRAVQGRPGFTLLSESSPLTWGQAGTVPGYCAHCALNEVESWRRLGYLLWVTDFDADPSRPCAWTIMKDRSRPPISYLKRLSLA